MEKDIVSYKGEGAAALSSALVQHINEFTDQLIRLSSPSELYSAACASLTEMPDKLVAIIRLPCKGSPLPASPDILVCHFGGKATGAAILRVSNIRFSKRVLDAIRTTDAPVMATSGPSSDKRLKLTVVDEHKPHIVFSARVNDLGDDVDVLYLDILESKAPAEMFDFIEAIARQINLKICPSSC